MAPISFVLEIFFALFVCAFLTFAPRIYKTWLRPLAFMPLLLLLFPGQKILSSLPLDLNSWIFGFFSGIALVLAAGIGFHLFFTLQAQTYRKQIGLFKRRP